MISVQEAQFSKIAVERKRQRELYGNKQRTLVEWCAILGEEVGEVNKAAVEYHFPDYPGTYQSDKQLAQFRREVVQVAAVCVQILEMV